MHIVFVVENSAGLVLAEPTSSAPLPNSLLLPFLSLYAWIGTVLFFMWVLAAAVVARRLLPKRAGPRGKKKICKKKKICFYLKQTAGSHGDM